MMMEENNKNFKDNSLQNDVQIQCNDKNKLCENNGEIQPIAIVSGNGNPMPLVVMNFLIAAALLAFAFFLFFYDIILGTIPRSMAKKVIDSVVILAIALVFIWMGIYYLKKARTYYQEKREFESQAMDETVEDEIVQRTCPGCGRVHDIDYPKCPNCKYDYRDHFNENGMLEGGRDE